MKKIFFIGCFVFLNACQAEPMTPSQKALQVMVGKKIDSLEVLSLSGEKANLAMFKGGKPIVLNIWATWCPPCIKELPSLDALATREDYLVVAISTDKEAKVAQNFLEKENLQNIIAFHDPNGKITRKALMALALPVTYILDSTLTIRAVETGDKDWNSAKMIAKIQKSLKN